jgi:tetratricopeptide (TPR) repeat protein
LLALVPERVRPDDAIAGSYRDVLRDRVFLRVWVLGALLVAFGFAQYEAALPPYATSNGVSAHALGYVFAANFFGVVVLQLVVLRLVGHARRTRLLSAAALALGVAWCIAIAGAHGGGVVVFAAAMLVLALGETLVSPSLAPTVNDLAPDNLRGRYNGAFVLAYTTGFAVGPALAGIGLRFGDGTPWFVVLAAGCAVTALWAWRLPLGLAHAMALRRRCDYRGALAALTNASTPQELAARSRLLEDFGRYEEARADAERSGDVLRQAAVAIAERHPRQALELLGDRTCFERGAALESLARLDEAQAVYDALPDADAWTRLGRGSVLRARGEFAAAERELAESLRLAQHDFGESSIEAGAALNGLGMTYKYWGRFDEGRRAYAEALDILVRGFGDDHVDVATIEHNLGGLEHAARNFEAAEPHARASVERRRAALGPDHVTTAEDEAAWAPILHALGRDEEAEGLLRHALPIMVAELGPDHPEAAGAWNNLASTLADLDAAADAYGKALEAKERMLGPDHPSLAITLNNLGVNARKRGRDDEAEAYYRRALAILEERVDAAHPNLALTRRNLERLEEDGRRGRPVEVNEEGR